MEVDDIHGLAHEHLDTTQRQELASWLLMEADIGSSDAYYERCAKEQDRRDREANEWNTALSAMKNKYKESRR